VTPSASHSTATDGRMRVSRGSWDVQTRQLQPRVGTPIDVPLPRKMRLAFVREGRRRLLTNGRLACRVVGARGDGVGDLHEHHAQLEQGILQQPLFLIGEVTLGLLAEHA
jgi:hypothetical protein